MVNKARLVESIADLVKEKRIDGIHYINDESGKDGMRIVIELKKDANPQVVLNKLFSYYTASGYCGRYNACSCERYP